MLDQYRFHQGVVEIDTADPRAQIPTTLLRFLLTEKLKHLSRLGSAQTKVGQYRSLVLRFKRRCHNC